VTEKMSILSVGFCSCFLKKSQGLTGRRMTVLPPDGFGPHGESKRQEAPTRQLKPTTCTVPVQRRLPAGMGLMAG